MNTKISFDILCAWVIGLAYAAGSLNTLRFLPDTSFLPDNDALIVLLLGLSLLYWRNLPKTAFPLSAYTWLVLALIILFQFIFNPPPYPDALVFPLVTLLSISLLSLIVYRTENVLVFIRHLAYAVFAVGVINSLIQHIQLWHPQGLYPVIMYLPPGYTPSGNVAQRNEASYINALALTALLYLVHLLYFSANAHKKKLLFLAAVGFIFLSVALGMGSSRIGILLPIFAITGFSAIRKGSIKEKYLSILLGLSIYACGYFIGGWLLQSVNMQNIIDRLGENRLYTRWSLWQQALIIFLNHPILGSGWGTFAEQGLNYADNIYWFSYSTHSHFFASQIGAELGIVGLLALIPAWLTFLRATRRQLSPEYALAWTMALVTLLYSCTEFPLWYTHYLCLFAALLAFLDTPKRKSNITQTTLQSQKTLYQIISAVCALLCIVGVYYHIQYKKITDIFLRAQRLSDVSQFSSQYQEIPNLYGLSYAKEAYLFSILPANTDNIEKKVQLGDRILKHFQSPDMLVKQGVLLSINHQPETAIRYFHAACMMDMQRECASIKETLQQLEKNFPGEFYQAQQESLWWQTNNKER